MADDSWAVEFAELRRRHQHEARSRPPGLRDAVAVLRIIEQIYKDSGYDHRS